MSKHLVPWKCSVKGYKTGCQKVKHRFGPIKAGLMCLLSLLLTPFILRVPPGSCQGWTPAQVLSSRSLWRSCLALIFSALLLQKGGHLPGPETGLLSNTRKWIVRGETCADKARDFIGKGHLGGEQEVREPGRTALLCGSQPWVLWWWD